MSGVRVTLSELVTRAAVPVSDLSLLMLCAGHGEPDRFEDTLIIKAGQPR